MQRSKEHPRPRLQMGTRISVWLKGRKISSLIGHVLLSLLVLQYVPLLSGHKICESLCFAYFVHDNIVKIGTMGGMYCAPKKYLLNG